MTRDELLLAAMAAGATTTAALARATSLIERTCRYGLSHLIAVGYVWSPERGRWRLTESGRAIAATLPSLAAMEWPAPEPVALPVDEGGTVITSDTPQPTSLPADAPVTPTSLWWTLAGIAAAVVLTLARQSPTLPPASPPPAPRIVWLHDGWHI
jgi:hypothetical protein